MDDKNLKAKNLPAEIADFYDLLLEKVSALRSEARERIHQIKNEQEECSNKLRESLARGESLRKADFNKLMGEIIAKRKQREKEVAEILEQFQKEEEEIAQGLKKLFGNGQQVRLRDFKNFIAEFKRKQEVRQGEVEEIAKASKDIRKSAEETIAKFRKEREEMAKEWQLLARKMQAKRAKAKKQEEK